MLFSGYNNYKEINCTKTISIIITVKIQYIGNTFFII